MTEKTTPIFWSGFPRTPNSRSSIAPISTASVKRSWRNSTTSRSRSCGPCSRNNQEAAPGNVAATRTGTARRCDGRRHGESRAEVIVSAPPGCKSNSGLRGDGPQMK